MAQEITIDLRKRKPYFELKDNKKVKASFKAKLDSFNSYLNSFQLALHQVEIKQVEEVPSNKFQLKIEQKIEEIDENFIFQTAREEAIMSNNAWIKFRQRVNTIPGYDVPPLCRLIKTKKKLNQFYKIYQNEFGSFCDAKEKISFILTKIYKKLDKNIENSKFMIEYCGDGTILTKTKINIINFTFNVLNAKNRSHNGQFTLGKFIK